MGTTLEEFSMAKIIDIDISSRSKYTNYSFKKHVYLLHFLILPTYCAMFLTFFFQVPSKDQRHWRVEMEMESSLREMDDHLRKINMIWNISPPPNLLIRKIKLSLNVTCGALPAFISPQKGRKSKIRSQNRQL